MNETAQETGRLTWCRSKVHRSVRVIGSTTLQHWQGITISCKQDDVIAKVMSGNIMEMGHVIMTTVNHTVTAILILNLSLHK